jgi:tRNA(fMet)-specific endonuclease VapC
LAYLLDTSVAIGVRDGDPDVTAKLSALEGAIMLSIVTRVELEGGVYREPAEVGVRRARLDAILNVLPVLVFDEQAADAYRGIIEAAEYSRRKLLDRMIAAQALVHRAAVITQNPADFRDIPGLEVIAW